MPPDDNPDDGVRLSDSDLLLQLQELQIAFDSGRLSGKELAQNAALQLVTLKVLRTRGVDEARIFAALRATEPVKRPL